ncbi:transcriptional regulator domain-containing protein [Sphingobium sp.]|uniref:transcriptional regulator domain-containing protein n=1 Tax=Sphingobium sp. TaxID=1912891 RepID=UPI0035C688C9
MWEWLRRDPAYVAWHAQASRVTRGTAGDSPWGLHFRRKSRAPGAGGADHLARRFRSRDPACFDRALLWSGRRRYRCCVPDAMAPRRHRRHGSGICGAHRWPQAFAARHTGGESCRIARHDPAAL